MDTSIAELFNLDGQVALITGGAKGIGRGVAEILAAAGARIALADTDAETAATTAKALNDQGRTALAVGADTSDETSVRNMMTAVMGEFQRLDILVNNAAIYPMARLAEMETALWDKVLGVNLRGPFLCTRFAAEQMIAGGRGGRIINISSINTARTYLGMAHYDASKGGLNAFTRASALEYAPHKITVNTLAPGAVKTPGSLRVRSNLAKEMGHDTTEPLDTAFAEKIPLGDWAQPVDIGQTVLLLTSRAAHYITGQLIYVDGGLMLMM